MGEFCLLLALHRKGFGPHSLCSRLVVKLYDLGTRSRCHPVRLPLVSRAPAVRKDFIKDLEFTRPSPACQRQYMQGAEIDSWSFLDLVSRNRELGCWAETNQTKSRERFPVLFWLNEHDQELELNGWQITIHNAENYHLPFPHILYSICIFLQISFTSRRIKGAFH